MVVDAPVTTSIAVSVAAALGPAAVPMYGVAIHRVVARRVGSAAAAAAATSGQRWRDDVVVVGILVVVVVVVRCC